MHCPDCGEQLICVGIVSAIDEGDFKVNGSWDVTAACPACYKVPDED